MKKLIVSFFALLWLSAIGYGTGILMTHEITPSKTAESPDLSREKILPLLQGKPFELILFAHPQCVCTRAALAELKQVLTKCSDSLHATIFFVKPDGAAEDWTDTENWRIAQELRGVKVDIDESARLAKQFGAVASGQTFVCNRAGDILFSGGITGARGVEGDNAGRRAVVSFAKQVRTDSIRAPYTTNVFGCALY